MKKSLLALAVLGAFAGAAQAQTSISISGLMDLGYESFNPEGANNERTGIRNNNTSTSTLVFSGSEDLGGGMKAGFFLATDWAPGTGGTGAGTGLANSQNFLSLTTGFGEFKVGNVNSQTLVANTTSQPFGTAIGGGYSGTFSRLDGLTVNGATTAAGVGYNAAAATAPFNGAGARPIRTENSIYYTSPNFSGFQATLGYKFENDSATSAALGMQEVGVAYRAGGLNAVLAHYRNSAGAVAAGGLAANTSVSQTSLGANYAFGPLTVYGGYTTSDSSANALGAGVTVDAVSYNVAAKYAVSPALAVMANFVNVNDKRVANQDRRMFGLGADYSLSKRTTAYFRYENGDRDRVAAAAGKYNIYALGLRHSF